MTLQNLIIFFFLLFETMSEILAGNIYTYFGTIDLHQSIEYGPITYHPLVLVMKTEFHQALVCSFVTFKYNPREIIGPTFDLDQSYIAVGHKTGSANKNKILTSAPSFWPTNTFLKVNFPTTVSIEMLKGSQFGHYQFPLNGGPTFNDHELGFISTLFYRQNFRFLNSEKSNEKMLLVDTMDILF